MGLTGRYNFPGIQKAMGAVIDAALLGTSWGVWLLTSPFKPAIKFAEDWIVNWLANKGLIFLNVGVHIVDGVVDQKGLDNAIDEGLKRVMQGRDKITPAEGKAIDDKVREAFDKDADVDAVPSDPVGVSNLSGPPV